MGYNIGAQRAFEDRALTDGPVATCPVFGGVIQKKKKELPGAVGSGEKEGVKIGKSTERGVHTGLILKFELCWEVGGRASDRTQQKSVTPGRSPIFP